MMINHKDLSLLIGLWSYFQTCLSIEVWEGHRVTLPCDNRATPANSNVLWRQGRRADRGFVLTKTSRGQVVSKPWKPDQVYLLNSSTSLVIRKVSYHRDNGWFGCLTENSTDWKFVQLNIYQPVKSITITGPENPISGNTMASFSCLANGGRPPPAFMWYLEDTSNSALDVYNQSDYESNTKLTATMAMNNKAITCEATVLDRAVSNRTVISIAYKPIVTIENSQTERNEGDEFNLYCFVEANPPADVTWSFKTKTVKNNVYRITNFDQSQTGIYKCSAKNREGTETDTTVLMLKDSKELIKILVYSIIGLVGLGVVGIILTCFRLAGRKVTTPPPESSRVENRSDEPNDDAIELCVSPELPPSLPEREIPAESVVEVSTSSESDHYDKIGQVEDENETESDIQPGSPVEGYSHPYSRRTVSFTREGGPYDIIGGWAGKRRTCSMKELGSQDEAEFSRDLSPRRRTN